MIRKPHLTWLFVLILAACSSKSDRDIGETKAEFEVLCKTFTTLVHSPDFSQLGPEERAARLELMLADNLNTADNAYLAWTAIRHGPPSERYNLFKEAAASTGYSEWHCPALAQHGHEVGASRE